MFASYVRHSEAKSLDADGRPGRGKGLLSRRPVREAGRIYIGKESNQIEEVRSGVWHRLGDVLTAYGRALDPWNGVVVPVLKEIPMWWIVAETGLHRRTIQRLRNRQSEPRPTTEDLLTSVAGRWVRERLAQGGIRAPRDSLLACYVWLSL